MQTVTLAEAHAHLPELIESLEAQGGISVVHDGRAVAVIQSPPTAKPETIARTLLDLPAYSTRILDATINRAEIADEMFERQKR